MVTFVPPWGRKHRHAWTRGRRGSEPETIIWAVNVLLGRGAKESVQPPGRGFRRTGHSERAGDFTSSWLVGHVDRPWWMTARCVPTDTVPGRAGLARVDAGGVSFGTMERRTGRAVGDLVAGGRDGVNHGHGWLWLTLCAGTLLACGGSHDRDRDAPGGAGTAGEGATAAAGANQIAGGAGGAAGAREVAGASGHSGEPATISIYLTGDLSPRDYADDLAGQTPTDYFLAISKYYLLTSADDPDPVLCFERSDPIEADLYQDTLVGACDTRSVPSAQYTHGRVQVDWLRYTVQATLHTEGQSLPNDVSFFRAFSDTTYQGDSYAAGEGSFTLSGPPPYTSRMTFEALPTASDLDIELVEGELWMTFRYTRLLDIDRQDPNPHWARTHWEIYEAFRWEDDSAPGYTTGIWDVNEDPADSEEVFVPGVSGYHVTASTD